MKPHEWQESIVTDWGRGAKLEELYQAFKARLVEELIVDSPGRYGKIIDTASTGPGEPNG